jgi:hypothetical protein
MYIVYDLIYFKKYLLSFFFRQKFISDSGESETILWQIEVTSMEI